MGDAVLERVLVEGLTLTQLHSARCPVALPALRHRFRQSLRRRVAKPVSLPPGRSALVLLVDGLYFQFDAIPWVLYLMAVKPCHSNQARFLDPVLLPDKESGGRWQKAIATLPPSLRTRIRALVADNLPGMRNIARRQHWHLQLCHFHLLMKLQAQRGPRRVRLKGGPVRLQIGRLIRAAMALPEGPQLQAIVLQLRRLSRNNCGTARTQGMVREFLHRMPFYRTYLQHPELDLPRTTNCVESMCRILREMFRSSRAGSNPKSVLLWATALIRLRPFMTCNGHSINRIS